jgi:hypothetical protein
LQVAPVKNQPETATKQLLQPPLQVKPIKQELVNTVKQPELKVKPVDNVVKTVVRAAKPVEAKILAGSNTVDRPLQPDAPAAELEGPQGDSSSTSSSQASKRDGTYSTAEQENYLWHDLDEEGGEADTTHPGSLTDTLGDTSDTLGAVQPLPDSAGGSSRRVLPPLPDLAKEAQAVLGNAELYSYDDIMDWDALGLAGGQSGVEPLSNDDDWDIGSSSGGGDGSSSSSGSGSGSGSKSGAAGARRLLLMESSNTAPAPQQQQQQQQKQQLDQQQWQQQQQELQQQQRGQGQQQQQQGEGQQQQQQQEMQEQGQQGEEEQQKQHALQQQQQGQQLLARQRVWWGVGEGKTITGADTAGAGAGDNFAAFGGAALAAVSDAAGSAAAPTPKSDTDALATT